MLRSAWFLSAVFLACSVGHVIGDSDGAGPPRMPGRFLANKLSQEEKDKCLAEAGMTKEDLPHMRENRGPPSTERDMCFLKCIGTTLGQVNPDGSLNINKIKEHIPPMAKEDADALYACLEKVGTVSACQDIEKVFKCLPKPPMEKH